jgi:oxygen-independent coproporphyrinogen III oxidase
MSEPQNSGLQLELEREQFRISPEFLALYNRPGPRYTSYPTAPVWREDFGPDDLERAYERADAAGTPISLYMHLPFCESLCLFCACNVVITKDHSVAPPYLATLKREIEHVGERVSRSRQVVQFHWGGGTPTYLTPAQMQDLFGFTADRNRGRPTSHHWRASGSSPAARLQPAQHGHPGL